MTIQVDNRGSLENVSTKWIAEIAEHCQGVKIVLCALKCDLREDPEKEEEDVNNVTPARSIIQYNEGLEVARRIGALRYLGMSHQKCRRAHTDVGLSYRMFSYEESRCQRSVHRSCSSRIAGQASQITGRQQLYCDVISSSFQRQSTSLCFVSAMIDPPYPNLPFLQSRAH